uniref:Uncharacterized protein n=1 Tax=Oryza brachyantha TaxID=4533 RepID=J3L201_ORYBR
GFSPRRFHRFSLSLSLSPASCPLPPSYKAVGAARRGGSRARALTTSKNPSLPRDRVSGVRLDRLGSVCPPLSFGCCRCAGFCIESSVFSLLVHLLFWVFFLTFDAAGGRGWVFFLTFDAAGGGGWVFFLTFDAAVGRGWVFFLTFDAAVGRGWFCLSFSVSNLGFWISWGLFVWFLCGSLWNTGRCSSPVPIISGSLFVFLCDL